MQLRPVASVAPGELAAAERSLVADAAYASLTGSWASGVVLAAFAIALGAGPFTIGLLAAIPIATQVAQLPTIALVERLRERKRVGVGAITAARLVAIGLVALPFVDDRRTALALLVAAQVVICVLNSIGACCVNSWLHQLIPTARLAPFFARRLLWGTLAGGAGALVAGQWVAGSGGANPLHAYAWVFAAAVPASLLSSWYLARAPEPQMTAAGPSEPLLQTLRRPLRDANFRAVLVFLGSWAVVSNIAAPFLTVYLMRQLGYGLATVTSLGVASQLANAWALYLWGRVGDRVSNKGVLATAMPVYLVCTAALVLAARPDVPWVALALLYLLHALMGAATGGIALATGNLSLKLAPQGQGTAYLAVIGVVSAVAGGIAPLVAGGVAELFADRELSLLLRWESPARTREVVVVAIEHWQFLFLLTALAGLYLLHALSRVTEEGQTSERLVVQQFAIEAARLVGNLSSIGGAVGGLFAFRRFTERRRAVRERQRTRSARARRPAPSRETPD